MKFFFTSGDLKLVTPKAVIDISKCKLSSRLEYLNHPVKIVHTPSGHKLHRSSLIWFKDKQCDSNCVLQNARGSSLVHLRIIVKTGIVLIRKISMVYSQLLLKTSRVSDCLWFTQSNIVNRGPESRIKNQAGIIAIWSNKLNKRSL